MLGEVRLRMRNLLGGTGSWAYATEGADVENNGNVKIREVESP